MPDGDVLTGEVHGEAPARSALPAPSAVVYRADPWEQQENESPEAYGQFSGYRDLDPEERSIKAAWRQWRGNRSERGVELGEHPAGGFIANYQRWRWEERARAYDIDQERRVRRKLERRRASAIAEIADLGEAMRKKASAAIRMMTAVEQTVRNENGQDVIVLAVKITPAEATRLAETGAKLELLALGEPTDRVAMGEDANAPFGVVTADAAKDELRKRVEQMRQRKEIALTAARELTDETREENAAREEAQRVSPDR
jgi:hypothetical protein